MKSGFWSYKNSVSLSLVLAALCQFSALAAPKATANRGANAMALYASRDYKNACVAFLAKTMANPYDAESFYYLGNCYVAMRNYPLALANYKKASDIAGVSAIGASSRTAMESLEKVMHPGKASSTAGATNTRASKQAPSASASKDKDNDEPVDVVAKKDPRLSAADTAAAAKVAEGDKAAQKILDEATARCKPIKQEEDRAVQEISENQQARMQNPDSAKDILSDVKGPYEEQIKNIMEPAKRRAQELKDMAKREADRIKQSALSRH